MMRKWWLMAWLVAFAGCASTGPTITSNADPATNFDTLRTFAFVEPLGTDRPGGVRTPLSNQLIAAASRELELRGMRRAPEGSQADMLVNFFVNFEQQIDVRQVPTSGGAWRSHRGTRYGVWRGYETQVRQFTQGSLLIDAVNPERNMLIWEGLAQGRLPRGTTSIDQMTIDSVVNEVMNAFPR